MYRQISIPKINAKCSRKYTWYKGWTLDVDRHFIDYVFPCFY